MSGRSRGSKTGTRGAAASFAAAPGVAVGGPAPLGPPPPDPRVRKQAVVVVHGMGEQRPLETLRAFVEAAYQRDLDLTVDDPRLRDDDAPDGPINRVWIVPDEATGSKELRRITTANHKYNRRTDFYEFYWADLTTGTAVEMVISWFRGLLWRAPWRVPRRTPIVIAWLVLWALSLFAAGAAFAMVNPEAEPFAGWIATIEHGIGTRRATLAGIAAVAGILILVHRLVHMTTLSALRIALPGLLLLAGLVLVVLPASVFSGHPRLWAAAITGATGALLGGIIIPYVGDIVRFVRATPSTIATRKAVRDRGLALLRALHAKGLAPDGSGRREYDRIVLVCHSLGAIIGYDLLLRFWEEAGPDPRRGPIAPAVMTALRDVDAYVEEVARGRPWTASDLRGFRHAQGKLHLELQRAGQGWLISDLITLGSPIVHSEFLIADGPEDLDRSLRERLFGAAPPRPDDPNVSMLYDAGLPQPYPHHAAAFAAVRWTNIYDGHWFPLLGDVVSGPVPVAFGPGIEQHRVAIRHGWVPVLSRFVTHTFYWTNTGRNWQTVPDHILKLRRALRLA